MSLGYARVAAEARMTSTATVRRLTRQPSVNPTTGIQSTWTVVLTDTTGRVSGRGTRVEGEGGFAGQQASREWHAPIDTIDVWRDGDLIEVTDGENAGRIFRVLESVGADQRTACRLPVAEVARPTDWG